MYDFCVVCVNSLASYFNICIFIYISSMKNLESYNNFFESYEKWLKYLNYNSNNEQYENLNSSYPCFTNNSIPL